MKSSSPRFYSKHITIILKFDDKKPDDADEDVDGDDDDADDNDDGGSCLGWSLGPTRSACLTVTLLKPNYCCNFYQLLLLNYQILASNANFGSRDLEKGTGGTLG